MGNKGETKSMKRLAAPKVVHVKRKASTFITKPSPGAHSHKNCVALSVALREQLGVADTAKEAKKIVSDGKVFVDGKAVKNEKTAIGFMDIISIPSVNKYYRVMYDRLGRLKLIGIERESSEFKLCKILNKTIVQKGQVQLNLHDGKNLLVKGNSYKAGDVIKVALPSLEIKEAFPLKKGNLAYVTGGKHAGETAVIEDMVPGTIMRAPLAVLKKEDKNFETRRDYVFVLGTKEPAVRVE